MTHRVILHREALSEALETARYIAAESSPATAKRWYDELNEKLRSLETHPHRCGFAREHHDDEHELRQLLHYSHRVIFTVLGDEVHILRVRHQRQNELGDL
ncbi:MAG: type II toxin-antitoxin system RelE/ParE family toxin [Planctomycetota bacterium]